VQSVFIRVIRVQLLLCVFASIGISQFKDTSGINYRLFTSTISRSDSIITLPDKFLIANTVSVYVDSALISNDNFRVDARYGKIVLSRSFISATFPDSLKKTAPVMVYYRNLPFEVPDVYSKFEILSSLDTLKKDTVKIAEVKPDFMEDIFAGSELEKSGSIFRGFTVGNNRDLTLNSGFRLQMNGKLSKDIDITAALTDENTPIQPEGNTQKLQELDKVFIELKSSNITATLGDIDVNFSNLDFFNFSRKVQGAKGFANYGDVFLSVSGALSRGRFHTNTFTGIDGVQGPYRLVGINNEVNIVVLAGSERVYLDGIIMSRGETNDYTIDYSNGQVTFTNKRLITNASRIIVDFEYTDKKYSRSLIAGQSSASFFKDKLKLSLSYLRENDDRDKPVDFILSDSDKVILSNAGDDNLKASKSGVLYVGRDSLNHTLGQYVKIDTTINGKPFTFYRYAPDSSEALYQVTFSFVGGNKGDYQSLSTTTYQFVGIGQGSYLPIIFLPFPVSYQSGDVGLDFAVSKSLSLKLETAVSDFDRNLFSSLDDTRNKGAALTSSLVFNQKSFKLGNVNLGDVELVYRQRYINKQYNSLDRLNQVEYNRVWDIQDSTNQTENSGELTLKYSPVASLIINGVAGKIKRGDSFNSFRSTADVRFENINKPYPKLSYNFDYISSSDASLDYRGRWLRQYGILDYTVSSRKNRFGTYNFAFQFNGEDKETKTFAADVVSSSSFRFYEIQPQFHVTDLFHTDIIYRFIYRLDDSYFAGSLNRLSNSLTHNVTFRLKDLNFLSSDIDLTVYDKKYSNLFLAQGFTDSRTILVTSQSNLWLFNRGVQTLLFYKVSSDRTAKSQVVFIKVPIGQGNYHYLGDINGNGIQEENEFILVNFDGDYIKLIIPTDQLFPTTDLQTSAIISVSPSKIFTIAKSGILNDFFKNISFDTYLSVNEKSKDPVQKNVYLMRLSTFQNDSNTIAGNNSVRQDINLFENYEYFALRLRFIQKKSFNQYFSGNERLLNIERSVKLRLSFTSDLSLQTDFINKTDRNTAPPLSTRNREIKGNSIISDLSYKPYKNIEVGFKVELTRANDFYPFVPTQADINSQKLRFSYSLESKGRLNVEVDRNEAILNEKPAFIPYELTNGIVTGKSYLWTIGFDYRISNFIQAALNYFGRAEGSSKVIHTGTAELRAFF
jgi:hypothetical protein